MMHSLLPILLEIHYRCADTANGKWIIPEAVFDDSEREAIRMGIDQGFIANACEFGPVDTSDYFSLSLTDRARRHYGLPKTAIRVGFFRRLGKFLVPANDRDDC